MKKRRRRILLRVLGGIIAVPASVLGVILLMLAVYLPFADYSEQLRARLEWELTRLTGAPAQVRAIDLSLARHAFTLRGVEVRAPGRTEPILEVDRVSGRLRVRDLLRLRLHWSELFVDGLSLRLVDGPDGEGGSAPSPRALEAAAVSLAVDRVSVRNAFVVLSNERVPWELQAEDVELSLDRNRASRYRGQIDYDGGRLRIRDRELPGFAVGAAFELGEGELVVHEATVSAPEGRVRAAGALSFADATRGRFDVSAEADVDAALDAVLARGSAEGVAQFRGELVVEPGGDRRLEGDLTLERGTLYGVPLSGWRGRLAWDPSELHVSDAEGAVSGGRARLDFRQQLPAVDHAASVDLELSGASLGRWTARLGASAGPLGTVARGRARLTWNRPGLEHLDGTFEMEGSPAERNGAGLSFVARGRIRGGDLTLEEGTIATPSLDVSVTGLYPREGDAALAIEAESSDLRKADRLQQALRSLARTGADLPAELLGIGGRGRARGRLTGSAPDLQYDGEITADLLELQGVRIENVRARGTLSREQLFFEDLVARNGGGAVAGRGSLSLRGPLAERDLDLALTLSSWPAGDLAGLLETGAPLRGELSGDLTVRRGSSGLEGTAALTLSNGGLGAWPIDRAEGTATLARGRLTLDPLTLARGDGSFGGGVVLDLDRGTLEGSFSTRSFPLQGLLPGAELAGRMEARIELSGGIGAPRAVLSGRGRGMRLWGVELGEAFLSAELRDGAVDGHASFEREASELVAEATCLLEPGYPLSGKLVWRQVNLRPWIFGGEWRALDIVSDGEATFRAALDARDPLSTLDLEAGLSEINVEGDRIHFTSEAPVELTLAGGRLDIAHLELAQGQSRVALAGGLELRERAVDLEARGIVAHDFFERLYPGLDATGALDLSARLRGSWTSPSLSGHADFRGGSVRLAGLPQALGGLRGRLVFDNHTIRVSELRGVFGSGPVDVSGSILLDGLEPVALDLDVRGSDIRLRYPEGLAATIDADLALVGDEDGRLLSGTVTLADAVWSRDYDLVSGFLSDRNEERLFSEIEGEELIENLRFDIAIDAPESLKLRNSLAEIDGSAELTLRGSFREPVLLGRSEARRGDVYFLGQRYEIVTGKVEFVDPAAIEPFIDLTAETRVRSYRVELRLTGTPERFYPELSSDPPLRTVDILRLLAGASERDIGLLGNEEEELAGAGVASLLTERLSQEVGRRAERLFGLDRFAIDPFLVGRFANPTARVSIGKQITRDLVINYSTNLNTTTEAIILVEYTPQGPMSWIVSRDEEGDVGIDVKFRKSF